MSIAHILHPKMFETETKEDQSMKEKFQKLQVKAILLGLTKNDLDKLSSIKVLRAPNFLFPVLIGKMLVLGLFILLSLSTVFCTCCLTCNWPLGQETLIRRWTEDFYSAKTLEKEACVLHFPRMAYDYLRPPLDCSFCQDVSVVERVKNLRTEEFTSRYGYSGHPVIITDATEGWLAKDVFGVEFFRDVYQGESLEKTETNCEFNNYNGNFTSLGDMLNMSDERAGSVDGDNTWYVGW